MDEPWKTLITLAAIVLLPVVPAFLLFRYLPSTGRAAGPLKGLNIKFTGAFAGYLTLFLSLLAVYRPKESPRGCFDDWTVSG